MTNIERLFVKRLQDIVDEYEALLDEKAARIATLTTELEEAKKEIDRYKSTNTIYYFITTNGNVEGVEESQNLASEISIIKD